MLNGLQGRSVAREFKHAGKTLAGRLKSSPVPVNLRSQYKGFGGVRLSPLAAIAPDVPSSRKTIFLSYIAVSPRSGVRRL